MGFQGTVFMCIDNSKVVNCVDWRQSGTPLPPASMSTQGTWQRVVDDLIASCRFHLGAGWLKSHVGFPGNELADAFAKYSAYACIVTHCHLQHPTRHSVTFDGCPCIHKFSGSRRRQLYPRHDHIGIVTRFSFDWSRHYSWFSSFADKWVMGVKGVYGASPFWDLSDRKCPDCNGQHPLDLASCVAFCSTFSTHRARMVDSWGPNVAPQVQRWIQGLRTKGELRNFARTLKPVSLYEALTVDSSGKRHLHDALAPRRKALTSVIKDVCSYRKEHPLPDPLPPPLNPNTFFTSHGPYSTSDRPVQRRDHRYHPPSPIPRSVKPCPPAGTQGPKRRRTDALHAQPKKRKSAPAARPRHGPTPHEHKRRQSIQQFLHPN